MSLHALAYCERLFYLEEVEEIRLADPSVYAGRTLHEELEKEEGEEHRSFLLSSNVLGIVGKMDAIKHREGHWVPYEHKRGRSCRDEKGQTRAWPSDMLQISAYGMLLEECNGYEITEGRIRYHKENVTVRVPLDSTTRKAVTDAIDRAKELRRMKERPPVTARSNRCLTCSLAPVCLPEEERLSRDPEWEAVRLFPPDIDGTIVHVTTHGARIGKSGEALTVEAPEAGKKVMPFNDIQSLVIHGYGQISTQALYACAANDVSVHWLTSGGTYVGSLSFGPGNVQRRIRQYNALTDPGMCLILARRTVRAKIENQLRYLLRVSRGTEKRNPEQNIAIDDFRKRFREITSAEGVDTLRGIEGMAARTYFDILPSLIAEEEKPAFEPNGRNRRPPKDRFNAVLSFGYSLLYKSVLESILTVGLDPALGYMHTPRSSAHPLVLDLMELFRVSVWDITVIGSINRHQWDPASDFNITKDKCWLSDSGRKKALELYEKRMEESWKHPIAQYSLSYRRTVELEVRLLEKEWTGKTGLFARSRLR